MSALCYVLLLVSALHYARKASTAKKGKVPNFAAIHQRQYEKMESLSEYKNRKDTRAKLLLSGKAPNKVPEKSTKKQLRFASEIEDKQTPPGFIPLPCTPKPIYVPRIENYEENKPPKSPQASKIPKMFAKLRETKPLKTIQLNSLAKAPTPKAEAVPNIKPNYYTKAATPKANPFNGMKPKYEPAKNFFKFNVGTATPKKGLKVEPTRRKIDEIKSMVATKSNVPKIKTDQRRGHIKGVRSNRRFELLMNMRKGQ